MKSYLRINIIEFILIIGLLYAWYKGVTPAIGLAILYILASTREKWVCKNVIEKKDKEIESLKSTMMF